MFDKELFERICNVTCSFEELELFVADIDNKEFDLDNAFEKYYRIESIIKAIQLYDDKVIDARYLAYWANAYDWIIMAGFYEQNDCVSLKTIIEREISEWLDSLSFFDTFGEDYDIDYKGNFLFLDKLYKTVDDLQCVYARKLVEENGFRSTLLIANHKTKEYLKSDCYSYFDDGRFELKEVSKREINMEIIRLRLRGYRNMKKYDLIV